MGNIQMSRHQECREDETYDNIQHSVSTRGSKVTSERVALLVVSALLAAAVIVVCRLAHANIMTEHGFQRLKDEHEALKRNLTERKCEEKTCPTVKPTCPTVKPTCPTVKPTCPTVKPTCPTVKPTCPTDNTCFKCGAGWEPFGEKCYYFSTRRSTWSQSRAECKNQGADLVKIDSRDEQVFLDVKLRDKMEEAEDKFWIGLTDSEEEGKWKWVDGSPLNPSLTFWNGNEPDNWTGNDEIEEDCARMGEKGGAEGHKIWFDQGCKNPHKHICEKSAEEGEPKCE